MRKRKRLLVIGHTLLPAEVLEYERVVEDSRVWKPTVVFANRIADAVGNFDAVVLLGLGQEEKTRCNLAKSVRRSRPEADLYIVADNPSAAIVEEAKTTGAKAVFQKALGAKAIIAAIPKPPEVLRTPAVSTFRG